MSGHPATLAYPIRALKNTVYVNKKVVGSVPFVTNDPKPQKKRVHARVVCSLKVDENLQPIV